MNDNPNEQHSCTYETILGVINMPDAWFATDTISTPAHIKNIFDTIFQRPHLWEYLDRAGFRYTDTSIYFDSANAIADAMRLIHEAHLDPDKYHDIDSDILDAIDVLEIVVMHYEGTHTEATIAAVTQRMKETL